MPTRAMKVGASGKATIGCRVNTDGGLFGCKVVHEDPVDFGFGQAALALAPLFEMKPMTRDGKPVEGGEVRIPITWKSMGPGGMAMVGQQVLQNISWQAAPTFEQVLQSYPKAEREGGVAGRATLICRYRKTGQIDQCETRAATKSNFGYAARTLAPLFRGPPLGEALQKDTVRVQLTVSYTAESLRGERRLGKPQWLALPTGDDLMDIYPEAAKAAGLPGKSVSRCVIGEGGYVQGCVSVSESPAGQGFGEAGVKLASKARMVVWTDEGLPTVGGEVRIPLNFRLDEEAPQSGAAK